MLIYYPSYIFIYNKYFRWYRSIVERNNNHSDYTENHHILPVSIFPEFKSYDWNISKLSYKEHFLAHWLLSKCMVKTNHKMKMIRAISMMIANRNYASWQYDLAKRAASECNKNRTFSDLHIKNISIASKQSQNRSEVKEKKSLTTKQNFQNVEFRERHSQIMKEISNKSEAKENKSKNMKIRWQDEEYKSERIEKTKLLWKDEEFINKIQSYNSLPETKEKRSKAAYECQNRPDVKLKKSLAAKEAHKRRKLVGVVGLEPTTTPL